MEKNCHTCEFRKVPVFSPPCDDCVGFRDWEPRKEGAMETRQNCFALIDAERRSQDAKWGFPQKNSFAEWAAILSEETGELCMELVDLNWGRGDKQRMVDEAIQVAAVAVSIIEQFETAQDVTKKLQALRQSPREKEIRS